MLIYIDKKKTMHRVMLAVFTIKFRTVNNGFFILVFNLFTFWTKLPAFPVLDIFQNESEEFLDFVSGIRRKNINETIALTQILKLQFI